jgi:hypothetical protein
MVVREVEEIPRPECGPVVVRTSGTSGPPVRAIPAYDRSVVWRDSGLVLGGQPEPGVMDDVSVGQEASNSLQPAAHRGALGRYRVGDRWPRCPWGITEGKRSRRRHSWQDVFGVSKGARGKEE